MRLVLYYIDMDTTNRVTCGLYCVVQTCMHQIVLHVACIVLCELYTTNSVTRGLYCVVQTCIQQTMLHVACIVLHMDCTVLHRHVYNTQCYM